MPLILIVNGAQASSNVDAETFDYAPPRKKCSLSTAIGMHKNRTKPASHNNRMTRFTTWFRFAVKM
jgi:hypothetical protein